MKESERSTHHGSLLIASDGLVLAAIGLTILAVKKQERDRKWRSLLYGIIRAIIGHIGIASADGKENTFRVSLPVATEPEGGMIHA